VAEFEIIPGDPFDITDQQAAECFHCFVSREVARALRARKLSCTRHALATLEQVVIELMLSARTDKERGALLGQFMFNLQRDMRTASEAAADAGVHAVKH
jgi:hypothetical protein